MTDLLDKKLETLSKLKINNVLSLSIPLQSSELEYKIGNHTINEDYLIVQAVHELNELFVINIDNTPRFPIRLEYALVCAAIEKGDLEIIEMEWTDKALIPFDDLTMSQQAKAQGRLKVIEPLIQNLEATLRNNYGENFFKAVIEKSGKSKQYVYDCFNAFLYYGQRPAALALPIGKNIFHTPKEKREIRVKQGRLNEGMPQGKPLDEYDLESFKKGKRLYLKRNGPSLKAAYEHILKERYRKSRVKNSLEEKRISGEPYKIKIKAPDERPTFNQFYYWINKEFDGVNPKRDKSRQNPIENKKDLQGRTGDANDDVISFGQKMELDETPFDEELVSVFDLTRRTKIGKATLYFVIDKFSKYIAGFFITTDNPSYKTVRQALYNVARDKKKFLEEIGLNPDAFNWEYRTAPMTLFVDQAEFHNKISEGAVFDLQTVVKFARKGRGDDKPDVEQLFDVFRGFFKGQSKALQTKSLADIYSQINRKHACLTINELYIIAAIYTNYHNNIREIKEFSFDRSILQDEIPAIPAKLCEWSMEYRPGYTTFYSDEELYLKLLAKSGVTIHQRGIYFPEAKLWYNCEWALSKGYQDRKTSRNKSLNMICRYNENLVDLIYLDTEEGLKPATLDYSCRAFAGLSIHEVNLEKNV